MVRGDGVRLLPILVSRLKYRKRLNRKNIVDGLHGGFLQKKWKSGFVGCPYRCWNWCDVMLIFTGSHESQLPKVFVVGNFCKHFRPTSFGNWKLAPGRWSRFGTTLGPNSIAFWGARTFTVMCGPTNRQLVYRHSDLQNAPILLLTGPAGCAKTATLTCLAKEMKIEVQEWINPVSNSEKNIYDMDAVKSGIK